MTRYYNECVGCELPCIASCQYLEVPHYYCDECGEEFLPEELYMYDDEMLCKDCFVKHFDTVADRGYMMDCYDNFE